MTFGPATVDGDRHNYTVTLVNSKNENVEIYADSITKNTSIYLTKGTYYLQVRDDGNAINVQYSINISTSNINLKKASIKKINGSVEKGFLEPNFVRLNKIKVKNSGACEGYTIVISNKKNMKKKLVNVDLDLSYGTTKTFIACQNRMGVYRNYYIKVRSFVKDAFGKKLYGSFSKVKVKKVSKKIYKAYHN